MSYDLVNKGSISDGDQAVIKDSEDDGRVKAVLMSLLAFGQHYQYASSEGESSTDQTAWQEKLKLTTPSLPAGDYRIGWYYTWWNEDRTLEFKGRVQIDDTTEIHYREAEPSDSVIAKSPSGGFAKVTLEEGVHTIDLDYCTSNASTFAHISTARLEIFKV